VRILTGIFLLAALTLSAQFDNAVILGTIRDAKGGLVAGAGVKAVMAAGGVLDRLRAERAANRSAWARVLAAP